MQPASKPPKRPVSVLVLLHDGAGHVLLLERADRAGFWQSVTGSLEDGETPVQAALREVAEETGITITNLRYFGSQPWPYPNGLMVGFEADYVAGNIHLQKEELSHGAWFSKENLPAVPDKLSIARKMIDHWRTQD